MSEGKWEKAKFGDIREGDVVRVTTKEGPKTTVTEGKITRYEENGYGAGMALWTIEDYENFYSYEFEPDSEGECATLEKFDPPFVWPTKLGAIVTGSDRADAITAILVQNIDQPLWWAAGFGTVTVHDIEDLEDLTVVFEGVTVEA